MLTAEIKRLSFDEESQLVEQARTDPAAETKLVEQYLPMFFSIAREYTNVSNYRMTRFQQLPTVDDVAQECYEPFKKAIQDYDVSRGFKFITLAQTYIRQHLDNLLKEERTQKAAPHQTVYDDNKKEYVEIAVQPTSLDQTVKSKTGPFGGDEKQVIDFIHDEITSRPDWILHYDELVKEIENELNSDKKKEVFRRLVELGMQPKKLKTLREEMGLNPSELSNILGRDLYPAVMKVLNRNPD